MEQDCKVTAEKVRVAEKDIDGLRKDMDTLEGDVRKISDTLLSINAKQGQILEELNSVIGNGGTPRCHERQVIIEGLIKVQADANIKISSMASEIVELKQTCALSAQSSSSNISIQKWGLEVAKSIAVAVVIALIITSLGNTSDKKEVTTDNANKTVQIR
jgi:hypothetical protein